MNPHLALLQPYPFEKLQRLFAGVTPPAGLAAIRLSIGEPQHEAPDFIKCALTENLAGLSSYPSTQGSKSLRQKIAARIGRRYAISAPDPANQVDPVNGARKVAGVDECIEAAHRIAEFCQNSD